MSLRTCCLRARDVLAVGLTALAQEQKKERDKWKNFIGELDRQGRGDALMDYCLIQFALNKNQLTAIQKKVSRLLAKK